MVPLLSFLKRCLPLPANFFKATNFDSRYSVLPQIMPFDFGEEPANSGDMTTTQCAVIKGDFPITITWVLNNKPIHEFPGITISQTNKRISSLSIESLEALHSGHFTCIAVNRAGSASYSAILNVNGT